MASNPNAARDARYKSFLNAVLYQGRPVGPQGALFLQAVSAQPDVATSISSIIASQKGLAAVQDAIRSDFSPDFLNGPASLFLEYLRDPTLKTIGSGQFLTKIILAMVEPPIFWNGFVDAFRSVQLNDATQACFAWLLLQLLLLPDETGQAYRPVAEDKLTLNLLLNIRHPDGKAFGHQIEQVLTTSAAATQPDAGFSPGGRHNNDFVDFREIAILPTSDEITCKEPPFLRHSASIDDPDTRDTRASIYLDNQFRLLREDMLNEMREELQVVMGLKKGRAGRGVIIDGMSVLDIHCGPTGKRCKWGLTFKCDADLPAFKGQKKRVHYLKNDMQGKKILRHQSLVCLLVDGEICAFPIINRDEELLAKEPPIIVLQFDGPRSVSRTLVKMKTAKKIKMVQINTATFAYEPILSALQNIKGIPLSNEILFWDKDIIIQLADQTPEVEDLVRKIRRHPQQDISSYLGSSKNIILDKAQEVSLLTGLTQRVSLIQGPPGTGKSFIGAILAKFLHDYSKSIILVVTATNHALDQFLEDLLGIGIPLDSLVRLGGKANAQTESMSLFNQPRVSNSSKADWKIIDDCKAGAEVYAQSLKVAFDQYQSSSVSEADIMAHLEFDSSESSEYFQAFEVPSSTDGMTQIGKNGRAVDSSYLITQWSSGKDAGIFKGHPHVLDAAKIWGMPAEARKATRAMWETEILKYQVQAISESAKLYDQTQTELSRQFDEKNVNILRSKRIIRCTTTGAAKYKDVIQGASPDVLLVEEAGEILESHVITALGATARQMILIGDHKQLRPKVNHYTLTVEKGEGYDLNMSLFERLVLKGYPHSTLLSQHRMRPEISDLVRQLTYPDLTDAIKTKGRPNLRGVPDNIVFVNHTHPEDDNKQIADRRDMEAKSSKQNMFEVQMVLKIVRYLIQQGYKTEELVVLTPYLGQLQKLQKELQAEADPVLNELDMNELIRAGVMTAAHASEKKERPLRLVTIDNYQGEESDVVIASLCRSNSENDIGFMFSPERLNVLLSRARNSLIIIGNANTFTNSRKGKDLWSKLLNLLRKGGHVYDGFPVVCTQHLDRSAVLKNPVAFNTHCPDGGCNNPCGKQLTCGIHTCLSKCHTLTKIRHSEILCQQITQEHCPKGHAQSRKCHQPSVPCKACQKEAEILENTLRREFELQQRKEEQDLEHERRLKDLEERIEAEHQKVKDAQLAHQRAEALRQKEADLKEAKERTSSFWSFIPSFPNSSNSPSTPSSSNAPTNTSGSAPTSAASPQSGNPPPNPMQVPPPQRPHTPPGNPATVSSSPSSPETEWKRQKEVEGASSTALDAVMDMIGLEDVKRQMLRLKDKIEVTQRQNSKITDERFNVVFLGNPGTGKTTVARHFAHFLTSKKVIPGNTLIETTGARLANEGVTKAQEMVDGVVKAGGGCVFVDETYQLTTNHAGGSSHQGHQVLDFLLAEMENRVGTVVFILAGYAKQMEKFFEHNPGLPSRVPYTLKFADYTDKELLAMMAQMIHKKYSGQMKADDGITGLYSRIAIRRLASGRGREGFGNARALQNMFTKVTERQAERVSRSRREGTRPDDFLLTQEDIIGPDPSNAIKKSASWVELQGLTGLKTVKDTVRSLVDMISANYHRELAEKKPMQLNLNRCLLGAPGTGKTTVGKLYGQILADIGMLSNGEVVVKNPSDFVGQYIGQSEANTRAILASTIGKILLIDEAYMLYGGGGGGGSGSGGGNSFNAAVIDTIVAEIQSVPGEDRCVLLLGYEGKMREMFQNVNEGLSRRFSIEEAFKFEDFTESELREILEVKLKKQDLSATDAAKDVAMELLSREKSRPNFGNAGAVENLLTHTKTRYMARLRGSTPPADTVFEPQDFDPEFERHLHAAANLDKMFQGILGCDEIIEKLREYQKIARVMKARGEDARDIIPTNFVFKGPPGTGKTTVARKIGQIYYDMGFLASPKVEECSATDLVGQYVGHTGPKTQKLLEKTLGQVLLIDEAYRLGEGRFAQEAIDELVGLLTQEKFKSKIVVILAGYEQDINKLLAVNSGLSSRFPEIMNFKNFPPPACLNILDNRLREGKPEVVLAELQDHSSKGYSTMLRLVEDLCGLPSWGNARDMETLAKQMTSFVLKHLPDSGKAATLTLSAKDAVDIMISMLDEQRSRARMPPARRSEYDDLQADQSSSSAPPPPAQASSSSQAKPPPPPPPAAPKSPPPPKPPAPKPPTTTTNPASNASSTPTRSATPTSTRVSTPTSRAPPPSRNSQPRAAAPRPAAPTSSNPQARPRNANQQSQPVPSIVRRDYGVSDAVWQNLQRNQRAAEAAAKAEEEKLRQAQRDMQEALKIAEKKRREAEMFAQAEAAARDLAAKRDLQLQREALQRQEQAARAERQRLLEAFRLQKAEQDRKKREEVRVQTTLRQMGVCVQGFLWVQVPGRYRCRGGSHHVSNAQLGI
ncbi:P-loop containing nucleoside triphosphate hydrolase protein [Athelia psychrophila]|uniref:P-loop containing nucleoside triphosphate hydrolase protein n=1 Tax=Athelia psychrophila TaxID=1759441 RepID=A0A166TNM3_9AGAM|nr:P-loop containing nucleoside triphosphate hydrolase protein [Fibularhizoctonia sp. CBS 109695]